MDDLDQPNMRAKDGAPYIKTTMTHLGPNTYPGFCPECSMPASIWNDTRNAWECVYCNWIGNNPDREPKLKRETYDNESN